MFDDILIKSYKCEKCKDIGYILAWNAFKAYCDCEKGLEHVCKPWFAPAGLFKQEYSLTKEEIPQHTHNSWKSSDFLYETMETIKQEYPDS